MDFKSTKKGQDKNKDISFTHLTLSIEELQNKRGRNLNETDEMRHNLIN